MVFMHRNTNERSALYPRELPTLILKTFFLSCGIPIPHRDSTGLLSHHQHHGEQPQTRRAPLGSGGGITTGSYWHVQDPGQLHIPGREAGVFSLIKPDANHLAAATAAAQEKGTKQYIRGEPQEGTGELGRFTKCDRNKRPLRPAQPRLATSPSPNGEEFFNKVTPPLPLFSPPLKD